MGERPPSIPPPSVEDVLARERDAIAEGKPLHFAVSAGVARRQNGESLDDLLRRADEGLYDAKRGGRDRVVVV